MTADEFYEWVHRPENRGRWFELERGEVVELPPPTKLHGFVCLSVGQVLWAFAARRKKGYPVGNDAGVVVEESPDTVRGPDVSFYEDGRTVETMERGYAVKPPRLVVEVLSPNDKMTRVHTRIGQFFKRGVEMVWVLDPEVRCVTVFLPDSYPTVHDENEELSGGAVLPDFRCRVSEFFALPGAPPEPPKAKPRRTKKKAPPDESPS
jgi:Uma2 family endonuclease